MFKVKLSIAPEIMKKLKLLLLLHQEFGAVFQEITKNVVLLTNLKQKLNFGNQKTAYGNFAKITSI